MRKFRILSLFATLAVSTCIGLSNGCTKTQESTAAASKTKTEPKDGSGASVKKFEDFSPGNFSEPTRISNEWLPMKPGTRLVFEGTTIEDDGKAVPHRVIINITDLTKVIGGIRSLISYDLDYSDGELVESELAYFAQDNDGNVWRMGEYPEEYEGGKLISVKPWIHGLEDARAGIMMKAKPQVGMNYSQGWGPAVNWTDRGKVDQLGQEIRVPMGSYKDVLVIAETSRSEPDAEQLKYYARGVGNVKVGWRGAGEKTKETLELVKIEKLDPKALAEVRGRAMKLEQSAYRNSGKLFSQMQPAEPLPGREGGKGK